MKIDALKIRWACAEGARDAPRLQLGESSGGDLRQDMGSVGAAHQTAQSLSLGMAHGLESLKGVRETDMIAGEASDSGTGL